MQKTMELTEPVYAHLWICTADVYNTISTVYSVWLKVQGYVKKWEETKFSKVEDLVAFRPRYCSLVGDQKQKYTQILVRRPVTVSWQKRWSAFDGSI